MRVAVTGGTGLVGSALVEALEAAGHEVRALRGRGDADLTEPLAASEWLRSSAADVLVHAAGRVGGIQANMHANADFLHENYVMGANVLRGALQAGIPRVINLASSCMYPRDRQDPLREEDILTGPLEPTNEGYALAKISVMRLGQFLSAEHPGFHVKTLVPCNLYGPADHFEPDKSHLVPSALRKVHEAQSFGGAVDIWGDGTARREFMHSADLADAVVAAAVGFDTMPAVLNIGTGIDHSVREFYEVAARVVGAEPRFAFDLGKPVGMNRKLLDVSRAHSWGWQAKIGLEEGMAATYAAWRERGFPGAVPAGNGLVGS